MALPRKNRLRKRKDFEKVFTGGKTVKEDFLLLKFLKSDLPESRFGFVISNRIFKKAVARNKLKRQLSEIVRLSLPNLLEKVDGVFVVLAPPKRNDFQYLKEIVKKILTKAKLLK